MLVVRPIDANDFEMFIGLAEKAGPGFTSLAVSHAILEERLKKSIATFSDADDISPDHLYLLVIEDSETQKIVGLSAVKAQIGLRDPFFNFRIVNAAQKSTVTDRRFDMEVLILVNEYAGASEVGTLFVSPDMRGTGAGRLISQARYMLMASDPDRFGTMVISELRGNVDKAGVSPFWEAIGRKFFHMDFTEADHISAEKDNQFILDLMPKHPIYAELLPEDAQAVMGQTHPAGVGAKRYLEAEGFRYNGVIDIFDAGPSMSVPRDDIRTVRESRTVRVQERNTVLEAPLTALISNNKIEGFRCILDSVVFDGEIGRLSADAMQALNIKAGDEARIWIKK